ncbi:hypothetical protein Mp_5g15350 [Marchantia polymorpha subsp. ruderalis]|uniref:Uncharacterized protein n=2 Tax=Marchantia polymorpha TaxID=3197 RepID=A0AAF6BIM6_MARPO|nr:hypothetical protein MARPO_0071s0074 [Marchantia polymorpha]BBN11860.1 hypothetical protein Mp_5g15350 [Marchantia polymorpha subsp. ruderalis]|eukprot:PTQ35461.1 hypothetical protein MARPO_0071s0074 [Marchantia polymorpha]
MMTLWFRCQKLLDASGHAMVLRSLSQSGVNGPCTISLSPGSNMSTWQLITKHADTKNGNLRAPSREVPTNGQGGF